MSSKDISMFLSWAEENEILWDKKAIEIKEGKHGLGVYAKKQLDEGYEVVKVPKSIVLSVETTGIANLLSDEEIEGYIGLVIGCMFEMSQQHRSPWSPYLTLLVKRPPQMATSLSKDAREMMKCCEAYHDIEADIKDMQDDYDSIVIPFINRHPDVFTEQVKAKFFTFEAFKIMTQHASSRAMDVDNFHISALVPFADLINHNQMPNADYLTHEDVCEICGNLVCEHREESNDSEDDDDDDDEDIELEDDGDGDKVPNLVGGNHHGNDNSDSEEALGSPDEDEALHIAKKPEKNHTKNDDTIDGDDHEEEEEEEGEEEEEEEEEWEDEDEDNEDDEDDEEIINDTCDIILDYPVKKGEEITRHYGPYSNKVLLSKYGFAVEDNAHDTVTIQLEMVRQAAEQFIKDKTLVEERIEWFLENEDAFIGDEHEDNDHEYGHEGGCCDSDDNHMHDHGVEQGREEVEEVDAKHKHFKNSKKKSQIKEQKIDDEDQEETEDEGQDMSENGEEDEENEEDEDEEGFPKDLMYMMHDGSVDDRLLMLLNVLFMEKNQFKKVKEDMDIATEYFSDIFRRRQQEEHGDDDDEDESEDEDMEVEDEEGDEEDNAKVTMKALQKPELKPRDVKSKKVRRAVLKAILALIRIRADTFGVTDKTTAEQDLESLKKAKLSGPLYYGGLCVQGEKQILQNALQGYTHFLSEL